MSDSDKGWPPRTHYPLSRDAILRDHERFERRLWLVGWALTFAAGYGIGAWIGL